MVILVACNSNIHHRSTEANFSEKFSEYKSALLLGWLRNRHHRQFTNTVVSEFQLSSGMIKLRINGQHQINVLNIFLLPKSFSKLEKYKYKAHVKQLRQQK